MIYMGAFIIWSILILIVILAIVAIFVTKKGGKAPTDYYSLFVMGITWLPFGIVIKLIDPEVFIGNLFLVLGFIYMVIGLTHKKEWKANHKSLNKKERKIKLIAVLILGVLVLAGLIVFYLVK